MSFPEHVSSGRELASHMSSGFHRYDWMAELARRSGITKEAAAHRLDSDTTPPPDIVACALSMFESQEWLGRELLTDNELPFSGLPGNLGKLHGG